MECGNKGEIDPPVEEKKNIGSIALWIAYENIDLATSNYWLIADIKKMLQGKKFGLNEEVTAETEDGFMRKDKSFYIKCIEKLEEHWNECVTLEDEYFNN